MFASILNKYDYHGNFTFEKGESYKEKCNAPKDGCGVYLIYEVKDDVENLLYIGSSGQKNKNGTIKIRKGGMYDRLTNGYHPFLFGFSKRIKRSILFPLIMERDGIRKIRIYWWQTYDKNYSDFPTDVERKISALYKIHVSNKLPL